MQGLGSQLCDHLVKKVIEHLEKEINPRLQHIESLVEYSERIDECYACNTPYKTDSKKIIPCSIHGESCIVSCGEIWCKPRICNICNLEMCLTYCCVLGCKNIACVKCSSFQECTCNYCHEHHKEHSINVTNYYDFRDCFIKKTICAKCSFKNAICSNCNEEVKMTDIADVIDIKDCPHFDHTQCGRAICKNCTDNKRIKL
jgi:hypothetical protein